jgi:hypothetical protein
MAILTEDDVKQEFKNNVISYLALRRAIGWVGLLMPFAVRFGAVLLDGIHTNDSISAYYYTCMRDVFVASLVLIGSLMACYRSTIWYDNLITVTAGLSAIGMGLFPMPPDFSLQVLQQYPQLEANAKCCLNLCQFDYHSIFSVVFFASIFYQVTFQFIGPPNLEKSDQKKSRNKVYRVCGLLMFVAFAAIGVIKVQNNGGSIFWPETLAVVAFGIAWLVKGQTVLKEKVGV